LINVKKRIKKENFCKDVYLKIKEHYNMYFLQYFFYNDSTKKQTMVSTAVFLFYQIVVEC